tara:strand:+ start:71 stop:574 length:504 start_codon:yes stop_codon:yes gene_type:complete
MSILKVDSLVEKTSGNGVHIPGHVVQMQDGRTITYTVHSTTSYTNSNLSVTITPKYANSKLFFSVAGTYWWSAANASGNYMVGRIIDSRTGNTILPQAGNHQSLWFQGAIGQNDNYDKMIAAHTSIDNDNTTSRTYTVQIRLYYATNAVSVFEAAADNIIRVMEIAQ